jgi:hypothetical protein
VEVALIAVGGLLGALAVLASTPGPLHGGGALLAFIVLTVVTGLSVTWAVQPHDAWLEFNRTLAYLATFGAGVALARMLPGAWGALVGATLVAPPWCRSTPWRPKVFPATLNPGEVEARLREPFGYWNAVGLIAALGVPGALWLAARRTGHGAISALAYPLLGLLLVTILLAYSRGALLAVAIGTATWVAVVPLRLRSVVPLLAGALGALLVSRWAFAQPASAAGTSPSRSAPPPDTSSASCSSSCSPSCSCWAGPRLRDGCPAAGQGHAALVRDGPARLPGARAVRRPRRPGRLGARRPGIPLEGWTQLTSPKARTPANEPGRLTSVGSVRARYYYEALKIFRATPVLGAGAGGYATARARVREDDLLDVRPRARLPLPDGGRPGIAGSPRSLLSFGRGSPRRTFGRRRHWDAERVGLAPGHRRPRLRRPLLRRLDMVRPGHRVWLLCAVGRGPRPARPTARPAAPAAARVRSARGSPAAARSAALAAPGSPCPGASLAWTAYQPLRAMLTSGDDASRCSRPAGPRRPARPPGRRTTSTRSRPSRSTTWR